jgi:hypothetical protein
MALLDIFRPTRNVHRPIAAASACAPRKSIPFGRVDNIVLADPQLPDPWDPETWARLSVEDRKMHRQKQQQDREDATQKERGGKTRRKLDMLASDAKDLIPDHPVTIGDNVEILDVSPPAGGRQDNIPRHIKYDLTAKAPWHGGEVKPYLYGRRVVFIHEGMRGEPITR